MNEILHQSQDHQSLTSSTGKKPSRLLYLTTAFVIGMTLQPIKAQSQVKPKGSGHDSRLVRKKGPAPRSTKVLTVNYVDPRTEQAGTIERFVAKSPEGKVTGAFWMEKTPNGNFGFDEIGREGKVFDLFDEERGIAMKIDLEAKTISFGWANDQKVYEQTFGTHAIESVRD